MGSILLIGAGSSSSDSSGLGASPPTITSSATFSMAENTTAVGTVTATGGQTPYTFSISGGADSALFTINSSTGALAFLIAPDYETPGDAGTNNVYNLTVEVASSTGPSATQNIAVTVTDAFEYVADYEYQEIGPADFAGKVTLSLNLYSLGGNVTHEVDASAGNLSAAAMEDEMEDLVGVGNAEVAIFNGDFVVKFIGDLAEYDLDQMTVELGDVYIPNDDSGTSPSYTNTGVHEVVTITAMGPSDITVDTNGNSVENDGSGIVANITPGAGWSILSGTTFRCDDAGSKNTSKASGDGTVNIDTTGSLQSTISFTGVGWITYSVPANSASVVVIPTNATNEEAAQLINDASVWGVSVTVTMSSTSMVVDIGLGEDDLAVVVGGTTGNAVTPAIATLQNGANPVLPLIQWPLAGVDTTQTGYASGLTLTNNNTVQTGDGDGVYAPTGIGGSCSKFVSANSESYSVADAADLTIGTGAMTRYGWVRVASLPGYSYIFGKDDAGSNREEGLYYDTGSSQWAYYIFRAADSAFIEIKASTFGTVPTGTWMFVQTQVNPTTGLVRIRVNKGAWNSVSYGTGQAVKDTTQAMYLGAVSYGGNLNGYMAKWRCDKSIISDAKLDAIYDDEVA